jgi:hypothetical protein
MEFADLHTHRNKPGPAAAAQKTLHAPTPNRKPAPHTPKNPANTTARAPPV